MCPWAAQYKTWLLIKLTPKGIVFSFLFLSEAWGLVMQDAEGKELFHLQRGFAIPVQLCYPCAHLACDPLKVLFKLSILGIVC